MRPLRCIRLFKKCAVKALGAVLAVSTFTAIAFSGAAVANAAQNVPWLGGGAATGQSLPEFGGPSLMLPRSIMRAGFAANIGGGADTGGGGHSSSQIGGVTWIMHPGASDSLGAPPSEADVIRAMARVGVKPAGNPESYNSIRTALQRAIDDCPQVGSEPRRIIAVGIQHTGQWYTGRVNPYAGSQANWRQKLIEQCGNETYHHNGQSYTLKSHWQEGSPETVAEKFVSYWQGNHTNIIVIVANESQPFTKPTPPPAPPTPPAPVIPPSSAGTALTKSVQKRVSANGMTNITTGSWGTGKNNTGFNITDNINANGNQWSVGQMSATLNGQPLDVIFHKTDTGVSISYAGKLPDDGTVEWKIPIIVHSPNGKPVEDTMGGTVGKFNVGPVTKDFKTWNPKPNKVWMKAVNYNNPVFDHSAPSADPQWTNNVNGDNLIYRDGDPLAVAVNGPIGQNLISPLTNFQLVDDYKDAAYMWKPDVSKAQVFIGTLPAQDGGSSEATLSSALLSRRNVTSEFSITTEGTKIIATANSAFLQKTQALSAPMQVTLFIPGTVSFKSSQVLQDYGKNQGEGLTTFTNPSKGSQTPSVDFLNSGSMNIVNSFNTNTPKVGITIPTVNKSVVSSKSNNGGNTNIIIHVLLRQSHFS